MRFKVKLVLHLEIEVDAVDEASAFEIARWDATRVEGVKRVDGAVFDDLGLLAEFKEGVKRKKGCTGANA